MSQNLKMQINSLEAACWKLQAGYTMALHCSLSIAFEGPFVASPAFGIWCLAFGIWYLVFGIWYLVFGIWYLVFGFGIGNWYRRGRR